MQSDRRGPNYRAELDERVVAVINDHPGIRLFEIGRETGILVNNLRPRLDRLCFEGRIHSEHEPGLCRYYPDQR